MIWNLYNDKTKKLPSHTLLVEAISYVREREVSLDLGCGPMRDIPAIVGAGFKHIDAVDSNPSVSEIAEEKILEGAPITFHQALYSEFNFPKEKYDLVSAQYALPFNPPETFDAMFGRLISSLKIGGVFTGHFFGMEDSWASKPEMSFHTEADIRELLSDFDIHVLREEKKEGKTALGKDKFWHVFHVIATRIR